MRNKKIMRGLAAGMAVLLSASVCFPLTAFAEREEAVTALTDGENTADVYAEGEETAAVLPEENGAVIVITNTEDFLEFAKNCTLDSWSRGKTVILDTDIDLSGVEFSPVPTFGGYFKGNGHKITGLALEDGNSYQGLFRFVQEGGLIEGISVSGTVKASDVQEYIGGIAGSVSGTIRNCTFEGTVDGSLYVGGIAGINETTGRIEGCKTRGIVQGEKYTGGIAGHNAGVLDSSKNQARINPVSEDTVAELVTEPVPAGMDAVLEQTENTIASAKSTAEITQDTGGIAGYNAGTIKNCSNAGSIGYPHVGYNVGGIVGRSMGYLSGCTNSGSVFGRKDVGGIAGQLAPDIKLVFSSDTLDKLDHELSVLSSLADDAMDHTDGNRSVISKRLDLISDYAKEASDNTSDLADMTIDWADTNIEEINSMMDTISDTVDRMEEITGTAESILDTTAEGIDLLEDSMDEAGDALGIGKQGTKELREKINQLRSNNHAQKECVAAMKTGAKAALQAIVSGDLSGASDAAESIKAEMDEYLELAADSKEILSEISSDTSDLPDIGRKLQNSAADLSDAMDSLDHVAGDLADTADSLHKLFRDISDRDDIQFTTLGDDYKDKGDQVHGSISSIGDQLDLLQNEVNATGDALSGDMRSLKDQLKVINDILDDAADEAREKEMDDIWDDVSEEEISNTTIGKAEYCRNNGTIEGDINAGGIAGTMAVESDLDPEEDVEEIGKESFNFHYETRAILFGCENRGDVTSKRDGAGGIAGRMDLGYILSCQNYGKVESSEGSYIGGIAGSSASTIRKSFSKCILSGKNYVGGIAGEAYNLYENTAFVDVLDSEMYAGAVAGHVNTEGNASGNRFVDNGTAGIDGISYAGKAEPVEYLSLMAEEETPEEFSRFRLTYVADGVVTARVACSYGESYENLAVPAVPQKAGYNGVWEKTDKDTVTFDHIFKAVYTPYVSTIASDSMRDSVHAVMLAEGLFDNEARLTAEKVSDNGNSETWQISLAAKAGASPDGAAQNGMSQDEAAQEENSQEEAPSYTYRFIPPAEWKNLSLTILTDEGEAAITWEKDKSACVFTTDKTEFMLTAEKESGAAGWAVYVLTGAGILAAVGCAAFALKKRKAFLLKSNGK